ncbi:MAG: cytochrome c oxidase assembly protein [Ilumatobacteraceae bacterium]|nr:cytochrome c oxidase assembly protein [Ilumatobacteraceae bacterium]
MNWWCSSSARNWTWTPRPYLGAWAILLGVLALAAWWHWRGRHQEPELDAREAAALEAGSGAYPGSGASRALSFAFGIIGLWACLDWPLASLGAGYLATAQMMRQVLMVFAVAPLLLYACPAGLAVRVVGWGRRLTVLRWSARPLIAIPVAAVTLLAVNAPAILDPLVSTPYGAFAMDLAWVVAGFILWMPVQCPHPGVHRLTGAVALAYLIVQSVVPLLPGFFMTWADNAIYSTYDLAPRVFAGFDAVVDQQTAAAILQVGGMVFLWVQISFRFLHWGYQELEKDRAPRKPITETRATTS